MDPKTGMGKPTAKKQELHRSTALALQVKTNKTLKLNQKCYTETTEGELQRDNGGRERKLKPREGERKLKPREGERKPRGRRELNGRKRDQELNEREKMESEHETLKREAERERERCCYHLRESYMMILH